MIFIIIFLGIVIVYFYLWEIKLNIFFLKFPKIIKWVNIIKVYMKKQ